MILSLKLKDGFEVYCEVGGPGWALWVVVCNPELYKKF